MCRDSRMSSITGANIGLTEIKSNEVNRAAEQKQLKQAW